MGGKWLVALLLAMLALSSCKGFKEGFKQGYDEAFVKSWKESFIKSCMGNDESKRELCTCVGDKAVEQMTVSQLSSPSESLKYIKENIIPECQTK